MKIGIELRTINKTSHFSDLLDLSDKTEDEIADIKDDIESILGGVSTGDGLTMLIEGRTYAFPPSAIEYVTTYEAD
ncbi:hypothetical protein SEA_YABOI_258 [Streptomyces phage Yaboi]|uniref:Uncharacterized protein n=2 Tax=Streptomyces virus Yaboi TaxID=2846408 RepID=A0A385UIX1_9CAUD|nr:hypothetical protein HWB86_gp069 [Streptomyces phage Yaboi]AYB71050.1 hypothetical protein SEA_YABOI_258 [Streptomyces phage Yaboi]QAY12863.1 hypothetical protein SEA_BOOMERJR_252 [Streptomyces phage BoomerJR]WNM73800.1 hypothetical protein SEA_SOLLERTIA_254 [Streptomyces phage Sollertia]